MTEYKVRAVVEFGSPEQWNRDDEPPSVWPHVPIKMGQFRLDISPNADIHFGEIFGLDPEQTAHLAIDRDYPMSVFYLDTSFEMLDKEHPVAYVDERFANFELLMRLFQPGDVAVRRHSFVKGDRFWFHLWKNAVRPRVATRYERPAYPLKDAVLEEFSKFFAMHWGLFDSLAPSTKLGLSRFNSSYERRELDDRLIDLVIALESLFSDDDPGSVTYKIATRCASWLHPPGDHRLSAFRFVKDIYRLRSATVHARSRRRREPTTEELDRLECLVRCSLVKSLAYQKCHGKPQTTDELDEMMMEGRFWSYSPGDSET